MSAAKAEIEDLFEKCKRREQDWLRQSAQPGQVARQWLFAERKFTSPPNADAGDPLIWKRLYQELVEQLRTADDRMVWYWLGQWFKSEKIRDPISFFPENILRRLTQEMHISGADIRNARAVRIWLPYTEPLVRKTKWLEAQKVSDPSRQLKLLGYDPKAVALISFKNWASPVEFTCEWVAAQSLGSSNEFQRETLVNSYSRYLKRWWSRINRCSFCLKDAEGEFWVREKAIPYCKDHRPDHLPKSESSAWIDRTGRRWWRDALDIRYAPLVV